MSSAVIDYIVSVNKVKWDPCEVNHKATLNGLKNLFHNILVCISL